jgi:hypothetical protein
MHEVCTKDSIKIINFFFKLSVRLVCCVLAFEVLGWKFSHFLGCSLRRTLTATRKRVSQYRWMEKVQVVTETIQTQQ